MNAKEYRANKEHVSVTELNYFIEAPICYKHFVLDGAPREETESMKLGTALHTALLEPKEFEKLYRVKETVDARTAAGKAVRAKEKELEEKEGVTFLSEEGYWNVVKAKRVALTNPLIEEILDGTENERSFFWTHSSGQKVKSRIDAINHKQGIVVDIKTTRSIKGFAQSIVQYAYHRQAAFYLDCVNKNVSPEYNRFMFICVELDAPYLNQVFEIDEDSLIIGRSEYENGLKKLKVALELGIFPGLPIHIKKVGVPDWYKQRTIEMEGQL